MINKKEKFSVLDFTSIGDDRGHLVAIEGSKQIPFDIKRVFYVYGNKGDKPRGCHANKESRFVLISVTGKCTVTIREKNEDININLDNKLKGLYLDRMIWKEMHSFSDDCVLIVLCSEEYNKDEYVYDFNEYLKVINKDD